MAQTRRVAMVWGAAFRWAVLLSVLDATAVAAPLLQPSTPAGTEVAAAPALECPDLDGDGFSGATYWCGPTDCDDGDPAAWQWWQGYGDRDGDDHVSNRQESICAGASLPAGWSLVPGDDCNDDQDYVYADGSECVSRQFVKFPAAGFYAADFALARDPGGRLHVWYTRYPPGTTWQTDPSNSRDFGSESTSDLLTWTAHAPILDVATSGGWDSEHVWAPSVIFNPDDARWYMFYTGVRDVAPDASRHRERLGVAVSDDLETWTRLPLNECPGTTGDGCIFDCNLPWTAWSDTTNAWTHQCRDPHVVRDDDGTYYLVYATVAAPFNYQMAVGLAASQDLLHWTDLGPVPGATGMTESPHLLRRGETWYLFWTADSDGGIRYATTADLAHGPWSSPRPLANVGWWNGAIASEALDLGDDLLFAYVRAAQRSLVFGRLDYRADGSPRLGPRAPLDCVRIDPALIAPGAPEIAGNRLDDDCDGLVDIIINRVALLGGATATDLMGDDLLPSWFAAWEGGHPDRPHVLAAPACPSPPWTEARGPGDFWRLWGAGADTSDTTAQAGLDSLCARHRVLVLVPDPASSDLLSEDGPPDPASLRPTLENARAQYRALRDLFDARPHNVFVVCTPPPRHLLFVPAEGRADSNAVRAVALAAWLRQEWLAEDGRAHPNVRVFDGRRVVADDLARFLRPEFERDDASGSDSVPNAPGLLALARGLGQCVIDAVAVVEGNEPCVDADGDGFGATGAAGCLLVGRDCNDAAPAVNPAAREICGNNVDENCDGALRRFCNRQEVGLDSAAPDAALSLACWSLPSSGSNPTRLGFALPRAGRVRVAVYNMRGILVTNLLDAVLPAGEHALPWNGLDRAGRPAPAGVFFVLVESAGRRATTKTLLLR